MQAWLFIMILKMREKYNTPALPSGNHRCQRTSVPFPISSAENKTWLTEGPCPKEQVLPQDVYLEESRVTPSSSKSRPSSKSCYKIPLKTIHYTEAKISIYHQFQITVPLLVPNSGTTAKNNTRSSWELGLQFLLLHSLNLLHQEQVKQYLGL